MIEEVWLRGGGQAAVEICLEAQVPRLESGPDTAGPGVSHAALITQAPGTIAFPRLTRREGGALQERGP